MRKIVFFFCLLAGVAATLPACQKNSTGDNTSTAVNYPNTAYGSDGAQVMDVYLPAGRSFDSTKVLVLIHGGAWIGGDKSDFSTLIPGLQAAFPQYAIVNLNYRLATATANQFPTQENDVKAAIDFVVGKRSVWQISDRLVLLGASAGAHLALLQAYKYPDPAIAAVVDFYGPTDLAALYNAYVADQAGFQLVTGGTPTSDPAIYASSSPVNFVTGASPPTIIFQGGEDPLVAPAQAYELQAKLDGVHVTNELHYYADQGHGFTGAEAEDANAKAIAFIQANVP